jgi:hypothetical protein
MNTPSLLPPICGTGTQTPVVLDKYIRPLHCTHPSAHQHSSLHLRSGKHPKARDGWYKWERENTAANVEIDFDVGNTQLPSTGACDKMIGDSYYVFFLIFWSARDYVTWNYRH